MNLVCLDMEGVLVPEIWIAFAEESGIPELKRTTRDEPDYDNLMNWRIGILNEQAVAENRGPIQLFHQGLGELLKGIAQNHGLAGLPQLV